MSNVARMNKIFRSDGKAVVCVIDHASAMGALEGIVDPRPAVEQIIAGGVDAIAASRGTAVHVSDLLDHVGMIIRVDGGITALGDFSASMKLLFNVEDALRCGADGVITMGYVGAGEAAVLPYLAQLADQCNQWGVALLAEMLPIIDGKRSGDPNHVATATRIGTEYGADFIKTVYTGDPESFRQVTECTFKPVLILGGSKMDSDTDVLETVRGAIDGGGKGVAMGRNIWQHKSPEKITRAIAAIVHDDASVAQAKKLLNS